MNLFLQWKQIMTTLRIFLFGLVILRACSDLCSHMLLMFPSLWCQLYLLLFQQFFELPFLLLALGQGLSFCYVSVWHPLFHGLEILLCSKRVQIKVTFSVLFYLFSQYFFFPLINEFCCIVHSSNTILRVYRSLFSTWIGLWFSYQLSCSPAAIFPKKPDKTGREPHT